MFLLLFCLIYIHVVVHFPTFKQHKKPQYTNCFFNNLTKFDDSDGSADAALKRQHRPQTKKPFILSIQQNNKSCAVIVFSMSLDI